MRAFLHLGLAASAFMLASVTSHAQGTPPPAPASQPSVAPYPYYPPPPGAYGPVAPPRFREGVPPPPGYHIEEHPRKGLVIAGSITFGTMYLLSSAIGLSSSNPDDRWLLLPIFGPFVDMAARSNHNCSSTLTADSVECNVFEPIIRYYLALDGIVQTAGGVLLLTGFLFPKKEYVSDSYYGMDARGPRISSWVLTPQFVPGS